MYSKFLLLYVYRTVPYANSLNCIHRRSNGIEVVHTQTKTRANQIAVLLQMSMMAI